jgi:hypothetical protein
MNVIWKNFSKQAYRDLRIALQLVNGPEFGRVQKFNESLALIHAFLQGLREKVEVALFALNGRRPKGPTGMVRRFYLEEPGVVKSTLNGLVSN